MCTEMLLYTLTNWHQKMLRCELIYFVEGKPAKITSYSVWAEWVIIIIIIIIIFLRLINKEHHFCVTLYVNRKFIIEGNLLVLHCTSLTAHNNLDGCCEKSDYRKVIDVYNVSRTLVAEFDFL